MQVGIPGRLPRKEHPNTLMFAKYVDMNHPQLSIPPEKIYLEYKIPPEAKQMFGNDQIGDCTCAASANYIINGTVHTNKLFIPKRDDVVNMYAAITGYNPVTRENDNGAAMTDVLAYMQKTGLDGHKILGWAEIDYTNRMMRNLGVYLFDCTYTGVNLPQSAEDQFQADQNWEFVKDSPIAGGHAIIRVGYGSEGDNYVTWAKWDQKASMEWSANYVEEEYVVLTEDWIDEATGKTPFGFDLDALKADLLAMKQ